MNETLHAPTFEELDQLVAQFGEDVSPVEIHALLTGYQCGGVYLSDEVLASTMLDFFKLDMYAVAEMPSLLAQLNAGIASSLKEDNFAFNLMLPEDEGFFEQMNLFSRWCESFINGFSATCPEENSFSEDIRGALEDLMAFSRIREEVDLSEQDEESLLELIEYSKVAVLMLYTELVLIPLRKAEQEAEQAEAKIASEKRMPPSDELH